MLGLTFWISITAGRLPRITNSDPNVDFNERVISSLFMSLSGIKASIDLANESMEK